MYLTPSQHHLGRYLHSLSLALQDFGPNASPPLRDLNMLLETFKIVKKLQLV